MYETFFLILGGLVGFGLFKMVPQLKVFSGTLAKVMGILAVLILGALAISAGGYVSWLAWFVQTPWIFFLTVGWVIGFGIAMAMN